MHDTGGHPAPLHRPGRVLAAAAVLALAACASVGDLPPVDLSAPGWTTWQGQALWRSAGRPPLAGEILAARNRDGGVLVSFSKPPVPIFTARSTGKVWQINFVERGRSYSGRGDPPDRFVWFRLPDILAGAAAPEGWSVERGDGEVSLRHGPDESIRLVLDE